MQLGEVRREGIPGPETGVPATGSATALIRHNADRLDHRLASVNPPGLLLLVRAVGRAVAELAGELVPRQPTVADEPAT